MEPENRSLPPETPATKNAETLLTPAPEDPAPAEKPYRGLRWIFVGGQGLRAGWSVLVFLILFVALNSAFDAALLRAHLLGKMDGLSPVPAFFAEIGSLLALLIAAAIVALIEGRRIAAYNLAGPRRPRHFLVGLAAGFLALSALVGALAAGGWLRFGPVALTGAAIFRFALLWACVFLVGASFEEGVFRCYGLFTLARGIDFWWALGIVAAICVVLAIFVGGSASTGVYLAAALGLIPCLILNQKAAPRSAAPRSGGFWCAAWVTSTLFGFLHISNPGESGVGILAAAFIGFVFCVSVRVTGSAWWAIGCHAAWDWGETFFYGTADSGLTPHGCYLTSAPSGNPLWSGGAVGPEGSVLVLGAILLLLILVLIYGRWNSRAPATLASSSTR